MAKTKKKINNKTRVIKPQNYLYAAVILIGGILLTFFLAKWYLIKKEEKLSVSYLIKTNTIVSRVQDLNSLSQVLQDAPASYFIYISYTGDEEIYNYEIKMKSIIDKYELNDLFYYVDVSNLIEESNNSLDLINQKLNIDFIKRIPLIIYVENSKINKDNIIYLKDNNLNNLIKLLNDRGWITTE